MNKIMDVLTGYKVLAKKQSKINGELTVVKDLAWGVHIMGGGVTQSGGVEETIWKTSLKKIKEESLEIKSAIILGLGGGTIAKLIRKNWGEETKITGIEIDPLIVELGKEYLDLDDYNVDIKIIDAEKYLKSTSSKFDLVCIDMYVQTDFPKKFENDKFIKQIKKLLTKNGVAVFNRLYFGEKRKSAHDFAGRLEKIFKEVNIIHPEANIMFACRP